VLLTAGAARLAPEGRRRFALAVPALLAVDLALAHAGANPALPASELYPETPAVHFLKLHSDGGLTRIAGVGSALQPNASLVYGLFDVRGDTPVKLESYQRVYASFASPHPVYFRPIRDWNSGWLDGLGVRHVVGAPGSRPPVTPPGDFRWRRVYDGEDARIWRRPRARPVVRWWLDAEMGVPIEEPGTFEVLDRAPGRWLIAWDTERQGTIEVAETWDPGWRATVEPEGGEPEAVPIRVVDRVVMFIDLPPGRGRLTLRYRPEGMEWGTALTLLGLLACCLDLGRSRSAGYDPALRSPRPV
jgi:hypothetical protein